MLHVLLFFPIKKSTAPINETDSARFLREHMMNNIAYEAPFPALLWSRGMYHITSMQKCLNHDHGEGLSGSVRGLNGY